MKIANDSVSQATYETENAYADSDDKLTEKEQMYRRNLNFRSSVTVGRDDAVAIAKKHIKAYNEFKPALIAKLPDDSQIRLAREGSVCIYVETETPLTDELVQDQMKADEFYLWQANGKNVYRIWWD